MSKETARQVRLEVLTTRPHTPSQPAVVAVLNVGCFLGLLAEFLFSLFCCCRYLQSCSNGHCTVVSLKIL